MSAPFLFLVYIKFSGAPEEIALNPVKVVLMGIKITCTSTSPMLVCSSIEIQWHVLMEA